VAQQDIEIILSRHLAEHLATPIFLVNPAGDLLFYNEPAENILGYRFDETGIMPASEWATIFQPSDSAGNPLFPDDLPLVIAITERHPAHSNFWIRGMDESLRKIEVTAFPLIGQGGSFLGAIAIFWEVGE
jgi:PAS domain-containing protein